MPNNIFNFDEYDPSNYFDRPGDLEEYKHYHGNTDISEVEKSNNKDNVPSYFDYVVGTNGHIPNTDKDVDRDSEGEYEVKYLTKDDIDEMYENGELSQEEYDAYMQYFQDDSEDEQDSYRSNMINSLVNISNFINQAFGNNTKITEADYDWMVGHTEDPNHVWCVDTVECDANSTGYLYETAVIHKQFNHGDWIRVFGSNTKEQAKKVHDKWCEDFKADKINLMVDIVSLEVYRRNEIR